MVRAAIGCLSLLLACASLSVHAGAVSVEDLKATVEKLRREINKRDDARTAPIAAVDNFCASKFGPDAKVTTKEGKLEIGGLVQVWYQSVANDNVGISKNELLVAPVADVNGSPVAPGSTTNEPNEEYDNDTFRVRRTEINFTLDIHENITAFVLIDPSREHNKDYLPLPTFPIHNQPFSKTFRTAINRQPQLLQDAYITYHSVVPHHDFVIGQFKPPSGEEAWRKSGQLEFVERAMVTGISNVRDIGLMVNGRWLETKDKNSHIEYWFGVFNGPENSVLVDPEIFEAGNRSDTNDEKDFAWRIAVKPVWDKDKWFGRLELGYARTDGVRGESSTNDVSIISGNAINGLNVERTWINRQSAWGWYRPGGRARGWWLRGEWGSFHDHYNPTIQFTVLGGVGQANPSPVTASGWYFGTGYKLSESVFAESLKGDCAGWLKWLKDVEIAFRYEAFENVGIEDLNNPDRHTDLFKTQAYTAGLNYYIQRHNVKLQANYIWVNDPDDHQPARLLRESRNDAFVVNFQVMF